LQERLLLLICWLSLEAAVVDIMVATVVRVGLEPQPQHPLRSELLIQLR
jgi:hypothetical protein